MPNKRKRPPRAVLRRHARPSDWLEPPRRKAASCCTRPICSSPRSSGKTTEQRLSKCVSCWRSTFPIATPPSRSPICAASSGTTTSTYWRPAPSLFSARRSILDGALTSNGQLLTLSSNSQVRRWDVGFQQEDLAHRRDLLGGRSTSVCVFSTDGRLAALADGDKVRVFDTSTGKEALSIDSANEPSRLLAFSRDSHWLAIVNDKIRWCKSATGEVIASVDRKFNEPHYLDLSADGLTLAVAGYGDNYGHASIYRLDATAKAVTLRAEIVTRTIHASALSPDGQRLAVGTWAGGALLVFDTVTGGMIARRGAATASRISALAFSDDGANLASADDQGTIKIWADARNLTSKSTVLLTLKGHQAQVNRLRFSNGGKRLFTASWRKRRADRGQTERPASGTWKTRVRQ